ncbi:head-tail adaptor protein [Methylobacterium sp. Leaf100]|uniref:head-tail adaptor protein n=1 Tax=Methylobacterium sp. Leaf100 TaxID=1736252 RepID=UPI0006F45D8E|nr:head-tail adaptor protein [Methylobacterium sp. Leaf100]KQP36692.1 head-tail adaptor protein [Methylobacterium sp. Leaf100]
MDPGRLDLRAQFLRQPPILDAEGRDTGDRGDYASVFTVWANFRTQSVREAVQGGGAQNVEEGALTIRDSANARTVTNADRVLLQSRNFAVTGVGLPDRRTGLIVLTLSSNLGGQ